MPVDLRQTEKYSEYIKKIGWNVDVFQDTHIFSKKFLFWRFIKVQRPFSLNVSSSIRYFWEKYRYSTVYIEPSSNRRYQKLLDSGFRKYNSPFLPSKTIQIDLTKTEDELLGQMHYKTRYNISHNSKLKSQNSKVRILTSRDINQFADFWQKCAKKRGMFLNQKEEIKAIYDAFGKDAVIHITSNCHSERSEESQRSFVDKKSPQNDTSEWLAAILRISTNDVSYYMYAAASGEGKKLFAPTILTWEAIKSAKKEGKKIFDFEGIFDERFPLKSWKGFTRFKKGFGGKEIEYPGCVSKIII